MTLRLRTPDEIERVDPLRARYVRMLTHAATVGRPATPSVWTAGLALCDILGGNDEVVALTGADAIQDYVSPKHANRGRRLEWEDGLHAHALLLAIKLAPARLEAPPADAARAVGRSSVLVARTLEGLPNGLSAVNGGLACVAAWSELARSHRSRAVQKPSVIARLAGCQQPNGTFLELDTNQADNLEAWWFYELVLLHAMTTYAMLTGDAAVGESARRAAAFHHAETQPDHATNQPWAIHAFLSDPEFTPTADLMLLAAGVNQPGSLDAVSRILLADAAVCLSLPERA